jgi:hypothetical protein
MSKNSVWKNTVEGKTIRRNKIAEQFAWQAISMLESPAYRALSLSGHRVLARINIEHARHGGQDNGKLPVTFQDFEAYGVHRHAIAPAIREVVALGFIRITQRGRAGNADWRIPNKFVLTHLPTKDNPTPTEDWKRIKTIEEAEMIAKAARESVQEKQKTSAGKRTSPQCGKRISNTQLLGAETALQEMAETAPLSISRVVGDPILAPVLPLSSKPKLAWSTPVLAEVFGAEKDELLGILAVPEPIPRKLRVAQ